MFSTRQWRRLMLVLGLAGVSYLLWVLNRENPPPAQPEAFTKGYAATGVTGKISNDQGLFVLRFQARELVQYDQSDTIALDQPQFWTLQGDQPEWQFSARQGQFDRETQKALFEQNVQAENLNVTPGKHIAFTTPRLWVDPTQYSAHTDATVEISGLAVTASAVGAEFDLGNNRHRLLSQVRMRYEDSSQSPSP